MWTITKQWAADFMSFEQMKYDYDTGCTVVQAENLTDPGQVSNGGGKSSFIDIVPIALLGQSITGRNLKNCVNWASDTTYFVVGVELLHTNGKRCTVTRTVYNNTKAQELEILVDGKKPDSLPTKSNVENAVDVREGNKYLLEEILYLSKEDLLSYYLITSGYYTPYMKMSASKRTEVINKISRVDLIDVAIEKIESQSNTGNRERFESLILTTQDTIQHQRQVLEEKRETLPDGESIMHHEDAIHDAKQLLEEVQARVIDTSTLDELTDVRKTVVVELQIFQKQRQAIGLQVESLKKYLAGTITCPKCDYEFSLSHPDKTPKQVRVDLSNSKGDYQIAQDNVDTQDAAIVEIDDLAKEVSTDVDKLKAEKNSDLHAIREEVLSLETELSKHQIAHEEIEQMESTIVMSEQKVVEYEQEVIKALKGEEIVTEWVKTLNDFKFHMANKPVKAIAGHINHYLERNKSDLRVEIEGFRKLKSGQIRQQLTPRIYRLGEEHDYASFSGGERARIDLSCDLAFQEIMNASSASGGLNYYQNDELLNPVDVEGIANAARAFDELDKTILLVSHSGSELSYEKVVMLRKENAITECITNR